jgi:short-subunit dehydrogenase
MPVSEKVIVITGASEGIGAELARQLGASNALVLAARREKELNEVAAAAGPRTLAVPTDVTKRNEVERLRDRAIAEFGHVDVWVNNAGRGINKLTLDLTDADVDEMILVNLKSALYGIQAIIPHFIERDAGQIINISSMLGRIPMAPVRSAYSASKAALNSLTANLRSDLRRSHPNIHVTLIMPGIVTTAFSQNVLGQPHSYTPPPGMSQTPAEVAGIIAGAIENPVAELYTQPGGAGMVKKYYEDVAGFDSVSPFAPPR